jgi:hypothetical protein
MLAIRAQMGLQCDLFLGSKAVVEFGSERCPTDTAECFEAWTRQAGRATVENFTDQPRSPYHRTGGGVPRRYSRGDAPLLAIPRHWAEVVPPWTTYLLRHQRP